MSVLNCVFVLHWQYLYTVALVIIVLPDLGVGLAGLSWAWHMWSLCWGAAIRPGCWKLPECRLQAWWSLRFQAVCFTKGKSIFPTKVLRRPKKLSYSIIYLDVWKIQMWSLVDANSSVVSLFVWCSATVLEHEPKVNFLVVPVLQRSTQPDNLHSPLLCIAQMVLAKCFSHTPGSSTLEDCTCESWCGWPVVIAQW